MKKGKREGDNEIGKLFMSRKKQKKHHKKKRPNVVATSSKNDESSDHGFSCDEDVPLAKKFPLNGCAAASKKGETSSSEDEDAAFEKEESSGEGSTSSAEDDDDASEKEESSREGSGDESSSDNSSSAEEDANVNKAPAAASKKEESPSSDNDEPTKVKKKDSGEINDFESDADKAIAVSEKKAESSGEEEREEAWKENETEFLIAILYAELVIHEKEVNQLDWERIVQKLYHQTRKQTSVTEVQTLYNKFRDETKQFTDLLQVTGYEWNPNSNKVTCKDDVWEHIYWIHGGEKVFRKKGLLHYNVLRDIFGSGSKHLVQESDVQIIPQTAPLTSTRLWNWLFG